MSTLNHPEQAASSPPAGHYADALRTALALAQLAGSRLRDEFHRPGGPRGARAHADIDDEVEWEVIRPGLLAAFPEWGYRGEESHPDIPPRDAAGHMWLVDPNDGTSTYLRGHRGPAVSIGLLRDGLPVLGVVYAYCAPDDDGDLLSWAEGQPLTRNGELLTARVPNRPLAAGDVVVLSQGANGRPFHGLQSVAPARFLAMPSIAYRLALVAAGDGQLAASIGSSPQDWDYAAGHALLRGAGGALLDDTGSPVTYTRNGQSHVRRGRVFGGADATIQAHLDHDWDQVIGPREPAERYGLARPISGERASGTLLSRGLGCLMGQLVGDALGSQVEFSSASDLRRRFPDGVREPRDGGQWNTLAGQPTDDSEMALLLARSILEAETYAPAHAAEAYLYWHRSHPFDIGTTTSRALAGMEQAERSGRPLLNGAVEAADGESQANGSLMRISPLAIWGHALPPERLAEYARAESRITHPNPVCQDACAVFTVALAFALRTTADSQAVFDFTAEWARAHVSSMAVREALMAARDPASSQPPMDGSQQGWVLLALQNAFHQLLYAPGAEEGIVQSVMAGGDTDTNAAIAGALLGAVHGYRAIPAAWTRAVLTCRPAAGAVGVNRPRPPGCWPVDALIIAERLLGLGAREAAVLAR